MRINRRLRIFGINCRFRAAPLGLVYGYAREIQAEGEVSLLPLRRGLYERKKGIGMEKDDMSRQAAVRATLSACETFPIVGGVMPDVHAPVGHFSHS